MNWCGSYISCFLASTLAAWLAAPASPWAQVEGEVRPEISGDPSKPRRHFRTRDAAALSKSESQSLYDGIRALMMAGYRGGGEPIAEAYGTWRRYNDAPYRSATHGQRYANNYANDIARTYGLFEKAGQLPVGSIIAKDSFAVTRAGGVQPGPLFVMEKMAAGFNYVSGDWRYSMIMPDGGVFGVTNGINSERVEYCIGCHLVQERQDHLYFIPEDYRVTE
jgi:hypothetical protein